MTSVAQATCTETPKFLHRAHQKINPNFSLNYEQSHRRLYNIKKYFVRKGDDFVHNYGTKYVNIHEIFL